MIGEYWYQQKTGHPMMAPTITKRNPNGSTKKGAGLMFWLPVIAVTGGLGYLIYTIATEKKELSLLEKIKEFIFGPERLPAPMSIPGATIRWKDFPKERISRYDGTAIQAQGLIKIKPGIDQSIAVFTPAGIRFMGFPAELQVTNYSDKDITIYPSYGLVYPPIAHGPGKLAKSWGAIKSGIKLPAGKITTIKDNLPLGFTEVEKQLIKKPTESDIINAIDVFSVPVPWEMWDKMTNVLKTTFGGKDYWFTMTLWEDPEYKKVIVTKVVPIKLL